MSSTPKKFQLSISHKTRNTSPDSPRKRLKFANANTDLIAEKSHNFKIACEQVSRKNYLNYRSRFLLVYLPSCLEFCKHHDKYKGDIQRTPHYADESFMIEMGSRTWYEALEICRVCLTPTQYLSSVVLKSIIHIILNAHHDIYSEFSAQRIIDDCQQILMQNFSTHPPCLDKDLRNNYISFLVSSMNIHSAFKNKRNKKKKSCQLESDVGIVKYCMNKLEFELSPESKDGPLVDKDEKMEEELRESVRLFYWQKQNEIFESLDRWERLKRLFAILETIVELLQFDLAIALKRTTNQGRLVRYDKLMEHVLRDEGNPEIMTDNCRQILKIFTRLIHLKYPEYMVKTFVIWVNTITETFYFRETGSNEDYPNSAKFCTIFSNEFYKIISDYPHDSIIRILERIEPAFMRHLIGLLHVHKALSTNEACIVTILINFLFKSQWNLFPQEKTNNILLTEKIFYLPGTPKQNMLTFLEKCILKSPRGLEDDVNDDARISPNIKVVKSSISFNHIVHALYITLDAYLEAYDILSVHKSWTNINDNLMEHKSTETDNYSVTDAFVGQYIHMHESITDFIYLFNELKRKKEMPEIMNVFENIGFVQLYNQLPE